MTDRVRFTRLKLIGRSPAHYAAASVEETTAMERGSAVNDLILLDRPVLAYPGKVRRGKEYEAFKEQHKGAFILTQNECTKVQGMAAAIQCHPEAVRVLTGKREMEIDWNWLGRDCQSHIDVVGDGFVTELKTTQSSNPGQFTWQALKMGYHAQLAFYRRALIESGHGNPQEAYVVAVESSAPYTVTVLRLTARALEMGERMCRLWLERLLACEAANRWPGYCEAVVDLDVPEDFELHFTEEDVPHQSAEVPF